jgi:DNA ligase-1
MKLHELVTTSAKVGATSGRLEKIALLAALLSRLDSEEIPIAVGFLIGWPRQGKIRVGWATVGTARPGTAATQPTLQLLDVDGVFDQLQSMKGKRSASEKQRIMSELLARCTEEEQRFLSMLVIGEVRQGALEGVMAEAVARAAGLSIERVRRATMLTGDLGVVARAALGTRGEAGLAEYSIELFRPVRCMLADSAATVTEALEKLGTATLEWKLDGARIQVHRKDDKVAVYSRALNDVTPRVPEVVDAVRSLPAKELILDGEVIALHTDRRPHPFQVTMRRFGRRLDIDTMRAELPLTPFFFDLLWCDGEAFIDLPLSKRLEQLETILMPSQSVPRIVTSDLEEAKRFEANTIERGHEGVMAKSVTAPYAAGRRGSAWLKVKTAQTLDLVVLAVEWGSGRRQGWLSNLHLGARDPRSGGFVMLGKTFKGMTDELLEWQTKELLERETSREGHIVHVRPELVVEIAFNEVQKSSQYPGGVALRFARVKGYRPDKKPSEADTIDTVRAFLPKPNP